MLQVAHVDRIAYENMSLHQGPGGTPSEQPELSPLASVMRVAAGGRGGYCFLLVDAYAALLCSLGFCVSLHVGGCGEDPLPDAKRGNHVVMLVHLPGHPTPYISDVGLGDGPSAPFPLRPHTWHEHGYTFALRDHGGGEWRFVHDAVGSFDGFTVSLATSCAGAHEFLSYHSFFWQDAQSHYRTAGAVLQRMSPSQGVLTLRNATLKRVHPSVGGKQGATLETASSREQWLRMVRETFALPLDETLATAELDALWRVVSDKQSEWVAAERRKHARRIALAIAAASVVAFIYCRRGCSAAPVIDRLSRSKIS